LAVSSALAGSTDTSFTVTSSLDGKTVLPLRSHWIAYPKIDPSQGQITQVDYLIDGYHAWSAHSAPWYYGDNGNWLVTSILKPGLHTFTVRAVVSADKDAVDKFQARVIAPPQPPARLAGRWVHGARTLLIMKTGWCIGPNQWVRRQVPAQPQRRPGHIDHRPPRTSTSLRPNAPACWKVTLSANGKRLQLAPIGDSCSERVATFKGQWARVH